MDEEQLGGRILWDPPEDLARLTHYMVYWARENQTSQPCDEEVDGMAAGPLPAWCRAIITDRNFDQLNGDMALGTNRLDVEAETAYSPRTHFLVFAASSLVEQTTPTSLLIEDHNRSVTDLVFVGEDLNLDDLAGTISWTPPEASHVKDYWVYLAKNDVGLQRLDRGVVLEGTNEFELGTRSRLTYTHFLVYTRSTLVQQTTPVALSFEDASARFVASELSFTDLDLDEAELGGLLTWTAPQTVGLIMKYKIYLAEDDSGTNRQLLTDVDVPTTNWSIPVDTPLASFTHVLVYTSSATVEHRTPAIHLLFDARALVNSSSVRFTDLDLDAAELGGNVSWAEPEAAERVEAYLVYLSQGEARAPAS